MTSRCDTENFGTLTAPWGVGDIDELWPRYDAVNPNSEDDVKRLIREDIIPCFMENYSDELRTRALDGLRYILSATPEAINSEWDGILPGFDLPEDPRDLFVWMKEVFEEHQVHLTDYE